jgi:hypothetical protein
VSARASTPADLQLEHTTDEHTDVLAQVGKLRARGQHALADQIERAYRSSTNRRGAFGARTEPPPPPTKRRRRR